jgi:hypothetical protein
MLRRLAQAVRTICAFVHVIQFSLLESSLVRCHILTAVWGAWHTDAFINLNLPSILAPGNLPAFARQIDTTYVIGTSVSDSKIIKDSPAYRLLQKIARVRIVAYNDAAFGAPVATHMKIWRDGVKAAERRGAFFLTNPADMVWADGSFRTVADRFEAGKKAVYAMFARVVDETFREEAQRPSGQEVPLSLPPRRMMELTLRHLHPFHAAYLRDSDQFPFHAEYIYWPVPGEGLLMRSLATTALAFHAREYAVNSNFSLAFVKDPDDIAFINDSDEICGVSLTPLLKDRSWYTKSRPIDLDEVGSWWITFDGPAHLALAQQKFRFHTNGGTSDRWRRAGQMSGFFVLQALISREMIRLARLLKQNFCVKAAEYLATALYAGRLRRRWHLRGPVSIFAPDDSSLARHAGPNFERLLLPGHEKELADFMFAHVVPDRLALLHGASAKSRSSRTEAGEVRAANGRPLSIEWSARGATIGGRRILARHELPLGNVLYIVDGILPSANLAGADQASPTLGHHTRETGKTHKKAALLRDEWEQSPALSTAALHRSD